MSYQLDFIPPLQPGDVALRFRVQWRGLGKAVPVVVNTQAVWVVSVAGDLVTWTNGRRSRNGSEFRHTSHRRELISTVGLESLAAECALTRNGCGCEAAEPSTVSAA
jgi:hypothetical protein